MKEVVSYVFSNRYSIAKVNRSRHNKVWCGTGMTIDGPEPLRRGICGLLRSGAVGGTADGGVSGVRLLGILGPTAG
jgi:hypothetical protein